MLKLFPLPLIRFQGNEQVHSVGEVSGKLSIDIIDREKRLKLTSGTWSGSALAIFSGGSTEVDGIPFSSKAVGST